MRIVITANSSFNIANFRSGLIRAMHSEGHDVTMLAPFDDFTEVVRDLGCATVDLRLDRRGTSLGSEATTLLATIAAIRRLKPDVIFSFTIKNNLYGGMASRLIGVPIVPNVTGLGTLFSGRTALTSVAQIMYRQAFRRAPCVFFQNEEDRAYFLSTGIATPVQARLLPGSGVDLNRFESTPVRERPGAPAFLLVARMLWEKGVGEFVEAARRVRAEHPGATFRLVGDTEPGSDASVPREAIDGWVLEGIIEYLGRVRDIRPVIAEASCVVLPSYYREGTPRALLEAAACGRPIITTDTPGCRTVVQEGRSGFVVAPRDSADLARAMLKIARADNATLTAMGAEGHSHAAECFDERLVISAYSEIITCIKAERGPQGTARLEPGIRNP